MRMRVARSTGQAPEPGRPANSIPARSVGLRLESARVTRLTAFEREFEVPPYLRAGEAGFQLGAVIAPESASYGVRLEGSGCSLRMHLLNGIWSGMELLQGSLVLQSQWWSPALSSDQEVVQQLLELAATRRLPDAVQLARQFRQPELWAELLAEFRAGDGRGSSGLLLLAAGQPGVAERVFATLESPDDGEAFTAYATLAARELLQAEPGSATWKRLAGLLAASQRSSVRTAVFNALWRQRGLVSDSEYLSFLTAHWLEGRLDLSLSEPVEGLTRSQRLGLSFRPPYPGAPPLPELGEATVGWWATHGYPEDLFRSMRVDELDLAVTGHRRAADWMVVDGGREGIFLSLTTTSEQSLCAALCKAHWWQFVKGYREEGVRQFLCAPESTLLQFERDSFSRLRLTIHTGALELTASLNPEQQAEFEQMLVEAERHLKWQMLGKSVQLPQVPARLHHGYLACGYGQEHTLLGLETDLRRQTMELNAEHGSPLRLQSRAEFEALRQSLNNAFQVAQDFQSGVEPLTVIRLPSSLLTYHLIFVAQRAQDRKAWVGLASYSRVEEYQLTGVAAVPVSEQATLDRLLLAGARHLDWAALPDVEPNLYQAVVDPSMGLMLVLKRETEGWRLLPWAGLSASYESEQGFASAQEAKAYAADRYGTELQWQACDRSGSPLSLIELLYEIFASGLSGAELCAVAWLACSRVVLDRQGLPVPLVEQLTFITHRAVSGLLDELWELWDGSDEGLPGAPWAGGYDLIVSVDIYHQLVEVSPAFHSVLERVQSHPSVGKILFPEL